MEKNNYRDMGGAKHKQKSTFGVYCICVEKQSGRLKLCKKYMHNELCASRSVTCLGLVREDQVKEYRYHMYTLKKNEEGYRGNVTKL